MAEALIWGTGWNKAIEHTWAQHTDDIQKQAQTFTYIDLCKKDELQYYDSTLPSKSSKLKGMSGETNVNIESILHNKSLMR